MPAPTANSSNKPNSPVSRIEARRASSFEFILGMPSRCVGERAPTGSYSVVTPHDTTSFTQIHVGKIFRGSYRFEIGRAASA
jgi:hypothetical protein